ncbi:MAG: hypothetical protein IJC99_01405 [Clostridia bacterium]|nr:hypothetical protein [Clostridia bacterium]
MPLSLFRITIGEYEHISFDAADASLLQIIIWGLCIGAVLASLLMLYHQNVPGKLVRALLRAAAHDTDTAKTLDELGLSGRPLIARELRRGALLQKFIRNAVQEAGKTDTATARENSDSTAQNAPCEASAPTTGVPARYYIPEELKYRAAVRYDKKGNGLVSLLITVVLSLVMAVLLLKLIPLALSMIDSIL